MHGHASVLDTHRGLATLAAAQAMAVSRAQLLALGVHPRHVAGHCRANRWREPVPGVVVLHRGPLPTATRRWVAVLSAGTEAALCSWTALELHGLKGWSRPETHLVVPRGRHVPEQPGLVVHESRRHTSADIRQASDLPVHRVERAAIDAASWSRSARTATGLVAAVVQQRLTTPEHLRRELDGAGRIRLRKLLFLALADIEGGAHALSEIDVARLCRTALPEPTRQRVRRDARGRRRYLDAEWRLADGRVVALEIDGVGHLEARQWYDDLLRQAELDVTEPLRIIRLPAAAARLEPQRVVEILRRALAVRNAPSYLSARREA